MFFFYVWNGMLCSKYIIVFSLENSFPIVPLAQALYITRQHYRRTAPSGVDNNRIVVRNPAAPAHGVYILYSCYDSLTEGYC